MALVSKTFSQIITFTRASTATYFDSAGVLQSAAIDAPRLDYNPSTLAAQGLLIEEQRTNSIRNNTAQGAVAGTPGTLPTNWPSAIINITTGLTREIVSVGTEDGINYIDFRISGTAVGAGALNFTFEPNSQIVAVQNQVWNLSCYRRLIAGSFNGLTTSNSTLFLNSYTAAGAFDASATSIVRNEATPTSAPLRTQRANLTGTLSSATTARVNGGIFFSIADGAAIDITLRIGLPQLELGAFATSVIPTTTTALTRSADVASVNTLSPWYSATSGTLFAEFSSFSGQLRSLVHLTDGTVNNRIQFFSNAGNPYTIGSRITSSGVTSSPSNTGSIALNAIAKAAIAYAVGSAEISVDGGAPATASPAATPTGINVLGLGNAIVGGTSTMSGHLRRVTYYPRNLSSAELQDITA